jgi:hypothetical protein
MTTLQHVAHLNFPPEPDPPAAGSTWSRWLGRIMSSARHRARWGRPERVPVYRITRISEDRWVVERPSASMEHAFADLEQSVAFIRHECLNTPATVELRVGALYVVAQLDPNDPASLFGESVP